MAASIYDWSLTAANNSNADADIAWPEGQAPSTVNNSARAMMQRVKELLVDLGGSLAASGTANGLLVTAESPFSAYADGQIVAFRATATNTGAATLSVNGIGAKSIRKFNAGGEVAIVAGDIRNTGIYVVRYSAALNAAAGAWLMDDPTYSSKPMTSQDFVTAGAFTWNNPGCHTIILQGCGGGGGGGGVNIPAGSLAGGAGGGGGGVSGSSGPIDVTAIASASGTIGAAGTGASVGANNGGSGGATTITVGADVYTWAGGLGGFGHTANAAHATAAAGGGVTAGTALIRGWGGMGFHGFASFNGGFAIGVKGGNSMFGVGGGESYATSGVALHGSSPGSLARGSGGSGGADVNVPGAVGGAAGAQGMIRVLEFY